MSSGLLEGIKETNIYSQNNRNCTPQNKVNTVFIFEAFFHTNNWFLVTNETVIIITLFLQTRNAAWVGIFFVWVV